MLPAGPELSGTAVLWQPAADVRSTTRVGRYLSWLEDEHGHEFAGYRELWDWSVDDLEGFWQSIWDHFDVIAHDQPTAVLSGRSMPGSRWFPGATLNYAEHALRGPDDAIVVVARSQTRGPEELTRAELRDAVARARAGLARLGVGPGDRVAAYLPNIPEAVIALLATASLGATWACCAPEFGTQSVVDRLSQVDPKVFITVDGYRYGERNIDRRDEVEAIRGALPSLEITVRVPYLHGDVDGDGASRDGETTWERLLSREAAPAYAPVAFDHPLWVLFSSGTTGLPKAIVHGHGGIVLETLKSNALHSDLGPGDRYFFFCPTGWVVWNLLVSGLISGSAVVLVDGDPGFPDGLALWRLIEETGATVFGCGATFLMLTRASGVKPGELLDLTSLRGISSTGSPLPREGFEWVYDAVGSEIYLQSTSGGTDVCGAFVGGSPLLPVRAGIIGGACLGCKVEAYDDDGHPIVGRLGELVISAPMPSMPVQFWNDPDGSRYHDSYFGVFPGKWRHGDWIMFLEDGGCVVTGRSDATLNRGGVRLGTSEFYAALGDIEEVDDALVVHLEDSAGGLGQLRLFVALAPGAVLDDALRTRIRGELRSRLSPRHVPDAIDAVPGIPVNLTGKKLEIPVKRLLLGAARSDVVSDGAVRDPRTLDVFERLAVAPGGRRA
ncbi:MAG: acetoacetyl-CoA synthetase [Solirubrobacterales bacterium]|nr:acetoacetyl-CoA synthetase [Solirubrobacterales bacterium]